MDERALLKFDQTDVEVIRNSIAAGATDEQLAYFLAVARRVGLDPIVGQIRCIVTKRKDGRTGGYVDAVQPYVGIDGLRTLAERSGKYAGQLGPWWCGPDGTWREVWLAKTPPSAAKVAVLRCDFREPISAVATWAQYAQIGRDGQPVRAWTTHGPLMLAKCAEALALRRAFPQDTCGLYSEEEVASFASVHEPEAPIVEVKPVTIRADEDAAGKVRAAKAWARLRPLLREKGITDDQVRSFIVEAFGKESSAELNDEEWDSVARWAANFGTGTVEG